MDVTSHPAGTFSLLRVDGQDVVYFSVADCDRAAREAADLKGRVVFPPPTRP